MTRICPFDAPPSTSPWVTNPSPATQAQNLEAAGIWGDRFFHQLHLHGPWNVREAPPYATPREAWDRTPWPSACPPGLCDAVFMCPGWETSRGCKAEMDAPGGRQSVLQRG